MLDFAINSDIIKKSGSWFSYNGERIGQGKDNVRKMIEGNPVLMAEIEEKVRVLLSSGEMPVEEEFDLDEDEDDAFDIRVLKDEE